MAGLDAGVISQIMEQMRKSALQKKSELEELVDKHRFYFREQFANQGARLMAQQPEGRSKPTAASKAKLKYMTFDQESIMRAKRDESRGSDAIQAARSSDESSGAGLPGKSTKRKSDEGVNDLERHSSQVDLSKKQCIDRPTAVWDDFREECERKKVVELKEQLKEMSVDLGGAKLKKDLVKLLATALADAENSRRQDQGGQAEPSALEAAAEPHSGTEEETQHLPETSEAAGKELAEVGAVAPPAAQAADAMDTSEVAVHAEKHRGHEAQEEVLVGPQSASGDASQSGAVEEEDSGPNTPPESPKSSPERQSRKNSLEVSEAESQEDTKRRKIKEAMTPEKPQYPSSSSSALPSASSTLGSATLNTSAQPPSGESAGIRTASSEAVPCVLAVPGATRVSSRASSASEEPLAAAGAPLKTTASLATAQASPLKFPARLSLVADDAERRQRLMEEKEMREERERARQRRDSDNALPVIAAAAAEESALAASAGSGIPKRTSSSEDASKQARLKEMEDRIRRASVQQQQLQHEDMVRLEAEQMREQARKALESKLSSKAASAASAAQAGPKGNLAAESAGSALLPSFASEALSAAATPLRSASSGSEDTTRTSADSSKSNDSAATDQLPLFQALAPGPLTLSPRKSVNSHAALPPSVPTHAKLAKHDTAPSSLQAFPTPAGLGAASSGVSASTLLSSAKPAAAKPAQPSLYQKAKGAFPFRSGGSTVPKRTTDSAATPALAKASSFVVSVPSIKKAEVARIAQEQREQDKAEKKSAYNERLKAVNDMKKAPEKLPSKDKGEPGAVTIVPSSASSSNSENRPEVANALPTATPATPKPNLPTVSSSLYTSSSIIHSITNSNTENRPEVANTAVVPCATPKVVAVAGVASSPKPSIQAPVTKALPILPATQHRPAQSEWRAEDNYEISDKEDSDMSGSDSDEDNKPKKAVPDWAQKHNLTARLTEQYLGPNRPDPDEIFGPIPECDLEAIFQTSKRRFKNRGSSGMWHADGLKIREVRQYRKDVGLD